MLGYLRSTWLLRSWYILQYALVDSRFTGLHLENAEVFLELGYTCLLVLRHSDSPFRTTRHIQV